MNASPTSTLDGWGPVPIGEVLEAALALKRREFRHGPARVTSATAPAVSAWRTEPGEAPIFVLGCSGSAGTSTVALLLAEAFPRSRLVECAPGTGSGLAGASTAELGESDHGWVEGTRGEVRIQRRRDQLASPDELPRPLPCWPGAISVVDSWWSLRRVLAGDGWLAELARSCPRMVLVTRNTVPGLRQLESDLALVETDRCWAVTTGIAPRRWSREVAHAMGPRARQLRRANRLVDLPYSSTLALAGITTEPLPRSFHNSASLLKRELLP
jgi:hypothetical protein